VQTIPRADSLIEMHPLQSLTSFQSLTSRLLPLPVDNVDTDQIIPASYLKVTDKAGLAEGLFAGWRYLPDGAPDPAFPLNWPNCTGCQILLVGENFGCGSSREHAPWALAGWGFRAIIGTSFADIFRNNALKNGLLPVIVDPETHRQLCRLVEVEPQTQVTIDLASQTVTFPGGKADFPIDPFSKMCLLEGLDPLGYLLKHVPQIEAFERQSEG
jgi:3-isopropylmalate/(R)-2-methylmalate dehydratase small subunit